MEIKKYFLHPGGIFASKDPFIIETILGSCVAVVLFDDANKIGGMNHYVLSQMLSNINLASGRYGEISIPKLIGMMKKLGATKSSMIAYIVGGASSPDINSPVGDMNIEIAKRLLIENRIKILDVESGGLKGRRISFNNQTGDLKIKILS